MHFDEGQEMNVQKILFYVSYSSLFLLNSVSFTGEHFDLGITIIWTNEFSIVLIELGKYQKLNHLWD